MYLLYNVLCITHFHFSVVIIMVRFFHTYIYFIQRNENLGQAPIQWFTAYDNHNLLAYVVPNNIFLWFESITKSRIIISNSNLSLLLI